jgi:pyridinium-3,5-biscarboxylic acid mononucleotide sulfurtransferase
VTDLRTLERIVAELDGVAVGLSGGVDSSLLAAVCHRVLGPRSVAVVARSPSLPARELDEATAIAGGIGIDLEVVDTAEVADPRYAVNPRNRCMFCKDHQFEAMRAVADRRGFAELAHGEMLDDLEGHRPGRVSAQRFGVRAPLREAGLDKARVRALAREFGLPVWDKPAFACLASRIPTGAEVTPEKLEQVERAEQHLFDLGFRAFRVRHHGEVARIELEPADHRAARDQAASIVAALEQVGFREVMLDTAGLGAAHPGRALPLLEDPGRP